MLTIFRFCENKSLSLQIKLVIAYVLTVTQVFRVLLFLKHALASLTAKLQLTAAHDMSRPINILRPDFERKNMELCELWLQALPSLPFPPPLSPYSVFLSPPPHSFPFPFPLATQATLLSTTFGPNCIRLIYLRIQSSVAPLRIPVIVRRCVFVIRTKVYAKQRTIDL